MRLIIVVMDGSFYLRYCITLGKPHHGRTQPARRTGVLLRIRPLRYRRQSAQKQQLPRWRMDVRLPQRPYIPSLPTLTIRQLRPLGTGMQLDQRRRRKRPTSPLLPLRPNRHTIRDCRRYRSSLMVWRIHRLGHLLTVARFFWFINILGKAIGARSLNSNI